MDTGCCCGKSCPNRGLATSKQISAVEPITPIYTAYVTRTQKPNGINTNSSKNITLETIITEYLTNQHALCKNPMSTSPQFDLIVPHKCVPPDPFISNIKYSRDGNFIAMSTTWWPSLSALWSIEGNRFHLKYAFEEEDYMEFANQTNDRIFGTKSERATIYNFNTGLELNIYNQYSKSRATYYPIDELILSDGVVRDVRSEKEIHEFDKLNQTISGVFHPNGLEVVSNRGFGNVPFTSNSANVGPLSDNILKTMKTATIKMLMSMGQV